MSKNVLIACRGEIAARIARACKKIGHTTFCVQSEVDADAVHVQACDEAIALSGTEFSATYGSTAALLEAADKAGADLFHPGYGPLASDATFARAVQAAGLTWIGPTPANLDALADAEGFRRVALQAEVRVVPEEGVERPRVVEVQLAGDGNEYVSLGEHEISAQQQGERLIAESPAPAVEQLSNAGYIREALAEASLRLARTLELVGLATVRFEFDASGVFYCAGVTLGLTAEHALHEMCTNADLVEAQFSLAEKKMTPEIETATPTGHAMMARLRWDAATAMGTTFSELRFPPLGAGRARVETGLAQHSTLHAGYDDVLAIITAFSPTRHHTLLTLDRTVAETIVAPVTTNTQLLRKIFAHEAFRAGQYDATFVDRMQTLRI